MPGWVRQTPREAQPAGGVREIRRLETRARLFDTALAEIGRAGLAGADVSAIASAAGVVRGTFYFHFPTKEHVLVELERSEEVRIVEELGAPHSGADDLMSVLSLLVRHVAAAERRLGSVVFRDMLGLHFSSTRPAEDQLAEHPLAEFVIAAITRAQKEVGSRRSGRERTRDVLSHRTVRAAGHRRSRRRNGGRRAESVCNDHREGNGNAMNGIDGYRDFLKRRDGRPICSTGGWRIAKTSSWPRDQPHPDIHLADRARFCGTSAAADPSQAWTGRCCSCWRPPS